MAETSLPTPPNIAARAYILMDAQSGRVLVEHNADERLEPASLTKIMTAYITFKELDDGRLQLDDMATISPQAAQSGGSRMFAEPGSTVAIENLVKGMLIQSGNDASIALAERIADPVRAADARHGEAIVHARSADAHESVEALSLLDAASTAYAEAGLPERAAECAHEAAAVLGRLGSYDASRQRYLAAREAYLAIPEVLHADDPDAIPDCDFNLRVLDAIASGGTAPPDAFGSGGHQMRHSGAGAPR